MVQRVKVQAEVKVEIEVKDFYFETSTLLPISDFPIWVLAEQPITANSRILFSL